MTDKEVSPISAAINRLIEILGLGIAVAVISFVAGPTVTWIAAIFAGLSWLFITVRRGRSKPEPQPAAPQVTMTRRPRFAYETPGANPPVEPIQLLPPPPTPRSEDSLPQTRIPSPVQGAVVPPPEGGPDLTGIDAESFGLADPENARRFPLGANITAPLPPATRGIQETPTE